MKAILNALARFQATGEPTALATVVATSGSAYRKPGTQLALTASGGLGGLACGGCLETDLVAIARETVFGAGRPLLVAYTTSASEEIVWGLNLGCDGVIEVLLEPAPAHAELAALARELAGGAPFALLRELTAPWRRCLLRQDGSVVEVGEAHHTIALDPRIRADAVALLEREACDVRIYPAGGEAGRTSLASEAVPVDGARVFIQSIRPAPRLVVFGAGNDAVPLVQMAAAMGWAVTVVDDRSGLLTDRRFAGADRLLAASPEAAVVEAGVGAGDYCVMMTHNFGHDRVLLRALCEVSPRHIGILGPRVRTKELLLELQAAGFQPPPESLKVLAAPLGLDVGGESPEEIALSAVAELQALRYGRSGGRLKEKA